MKVHLDISHPWVLPLGRHMSVAGNPSNVPPPLRIGLEYLREAAPAIHHRIAGCEAHPSTEFIQLRHLAEFGSSGQPMPAGALATLLVESAQVLFSKLDDCAETFEELRTSSAHLPSADRSAGIEAPRRGRAGIPPPRTRGRLSHE